MKRLKLTAATTVLTLALSFSAFAGDIGTTLTSPAPSPSTTTTTRTSNTAVDSVTQLMLVLLNLLP